MQSVVYAAVAYFVLLAVVRLMPRRPGGQMTPFEFVIVFLIGGVMILSIVGNDRSVTNSVCSIITIGLLHRSHGWLKHRYPKVGMIVDGTPVVRVQNGMWNSENMTEMNVHDTDVMNAARTKGIRTLSDVRYAILERNGGISVIRRDD